MPTQNPSKICIVSGELNRLFRNGGIGTACTGLSQLLAADGHRVTVVYTGELPAEDHASFQTFADFYARELGVQVVALRRSALLGPTSARFAAQALCVYQQLREDAADGDWDAIIFNDVGAEGFYATMAKRAGLAFARTALCVVMHGPRTWVRELNQWPLTNGDDLENVFMERETARFADHVISPSQYMLDWLAGDGWRLPDSARVCKCRLPRWRRSADAPDPVARIPVRELVFFGRLEYRKGVTLFCDMVDVLARTHEDLRITFLGKFGDVLGEHAGSHVLRRARRWPFDLRFLPRLDQAEAIDYLRARPDALPVIPSLVDNLPCVVAECLQEGLPFIATDTGGIGELVAEADRERCLCPPDPMALAAAIRRFFDTAPRASRPAEAPEAIDAQWLATIEEILTTRTMRAARSGTPRNRVSVAVITPNADVDPATLGSIERQTHADVEVRVVSFDGGDASVADGLGAARRAAIGSARAEHVLLVEDGTVLTTGAVGLLLAAAQATGADLITCFAYDRVQGSTAQGASVSNLGVGNAREAGYCRNVFGGTMALVRTASLIESGLLERESFGHDMWSAYCDASFAGLEIVCVPEPLGWAAPRLLPSAAGGYGHGRIRAVFERNGYRDCPLLQDLLVGYVHPSDARAYPEILAETEHGALLEQLCRVAPQSDQALGLMASHATRTQRFQTAFELQAIVDAGKTPPRSVLPVQRIFGTSLAADQLERELTVTRLDMCSVVLVPECADTQAEHPFLLIRVDDQTPAVQVHPVIGREISGKLNLGPAESLREVRAHAFLGNPDAPCVEFRLAVAIAEPHEIVAASAWMRVEEPGRLIPVHVEFPRLGPGDYDLVLSTRLPGDRMSYAHARFCDIRLVFGGSTPPGSDDGSRSLGS